MKTNIKINMAEFTGTPDSFVEAVADYMGSFDAPYLTLKDGSRVELVIYSGMFDQTMGTPDYSSQYFDIGKLESITFCGEEYFFTIP